MRIRLLIGPRISKAAVIEDRNCRIINQAQYYAASSKIKFYYKDNISRNVPFDVDFILRT